MNLNRISDKIVFSMLKHIKYGVLEVVNYDDRKYIFGTDTKGLNVSIKINKPGLTYNIIKSGSVGLAEAYMRGEFETNNLSDLIELTAKNIKIIYKFSGMFDLPIVNIIKNLFVKNTKNKEQEIPIDLDLAYVDLKGLTPQQLVSNSFLNILNIISDSLFGEPIPGQATDGENDNLTE